MTTTTVDSHYYGAAVKIAEMLGRKYGVNVVFGKHPATDGDTVYLPHWDLTDPQAKRALVGCIVHEAGGHVRQTNFQARNNWLGGQAHDRRALCATIENVCEDIRIENNLFAEYPGARGFMDAAIDRVVASQSSELPKDPSYWPSVINWLLARFRSNLLRQSAMLPDAALTDGVLRPMVGDDVLHQADLLGKKILRIGPAKSQYPEVIGIAEALIALFDAARPSQNPPQQPDFDQEDGSSSSPASGDGSDAQQQPDKSDQDAASKDGRDAKDDEPGDSAKADTSDTGDGASGQPDGSGRTPIDESLPTEEGGNIVKDLLAQEGRPDAKNLPIVAFPGAGASCGGAGYTPRNPAIRELRKGQALAGRLIPALAPLLVGEMHKDELRPRGRKLDPRRLARTQTNDNPSVFTRRVIQEDESIAFHILVDRSSSTRGPIYEDITISTLGLALALEGFLQVETSIGHFPNFGPLQGHSGIQVTKRAETPCSVAAKHWPDSQGGTPLAAAIESATLGFLASAKTRRVLFVLTDGVPDQPRECFAARRFAGGFGVEVYGIVVGSRAYPLDLFDDSEQIGSSSELPRAVQRLVLRLL